MFFDAVMAIPNWFFPAIITAFAIYKIVLWILGLPSLWIEGKPNEWVVIMRNGEFLQAGIGLSCFIGPFDQVAIFPSKLVKIEIKTQQVTQEMQGVEVSSMIEWTIDKKGEGPMKAFKNLDVQKAHPN